MSHSHHLYFIWCSGVLKAVLTSVSLELESRPSILYECSEKDQTSLFWAASGNSEFRVILSFVWILNVFLYGLDVGHDVWLCYGGSGGEWEEASSPRGIYLVQVVLLLTHCSEWPLIVLCCEFNQHGLYHQVHVLIPVLSIEPSAQFKSHLHQGKPFRQ